MEMREGGGSSRHEMDGKGEKERGRLKESQKLILASWQLKTDKQTAVCCWRLWLSIW